jgi:hypothetical protein
MSRTPTLTTTPAEAAPTTNAFLRWFFPELPLARVAVFRVFIYLFIIIDVLTISGDVIAHGWTPEFYQPLWLARFLHIPAVSVLGAQLLLAAIIVFSLLAAVGILQRISGWAVAITFGLWMFYTQGYGYVAHDHMALVIAALVLPTVGVARFRDVGTTSAKAGWALRVVQIAVVLTYFYSAVMKWIASGNIADWGNGAVIIWALMRRGAEWSPVVSMVTGILMIVIGIVFWATNGLVSAPSLVPTTTLAHAQEWVSSWSSTTTDIIVVCVLAVLAIVLWFRHERRRVRRAAAVNQREASSDKEGAAADQNDADSSAEASAKPLQSPGAKP